MNKVRIDAVDYDISHTKEALLVSNMACKGRIDYDKNLIEITTDEVGENQQALTLMHEIVHGIVHERGITNLIADKDQETVVDQFAKGVTNLIRDNPELIKHISQALPAVQYLRYFYDKKE